MAKKAYLKGEEFVFTRVKGSFETDYRDGDVNINPTNLGLGNVNNTSDVEKPVSTAQRKAIDDAYANSNKYTDQKIADLIGGASETMDTLKEVEQAIASSKSTEEALNKAIGTKANQTELDTHTGNDTIHITASERDKWNKNGGVTGIRGEAESDYKTGQVTISKGDIGLGNVDNITDAEKNVNSAKSLLYYDATISENTYIQFNTLSPTPKNNINSANILTIDENNKISPIICTSVDTTDYITTFTSGDSTSGDSTPPAVITSGETHQSLFNKISTAVKNIRWLLSKMGTMDIAELGDGTVTGALSTLNSNFKDIDGKYITGNFVVKRNENATSPIIPDRYNGLRLYYYDGNNGLRQSVIVPITACNIPYMTTNGIKYVSILINSNRTITFTNNNTVNFVVTHMYAVVINSNLEIST